MKERKKEVGEIYQPRVFRRRHLHFRAILTSDFHLPFLVCKNQTPIFSIFFFHFIRYLISLLNFFDRDYSLIKISVFELSKLFEKKTKKKFVKVRFFSFFCDNVKKNLFIISLKVVANAYYFGADNNLQHTK